VSYSRARRLVLKLAGPWCEWELLVRMEGTIRLGIDEHSFRGKDLAIAITCLSSRRMVAILPSDWQAELRAALGKLPEEGVRQRIEAVCIDMKRSLRAVVREELPSAKVVADPFHVIADANRRLDETRRLERGKARTTLPRWPLLKAPEKLSCRHQTQLDWLVGCFSMLAEHYWVKERLRALHRCATRAQAEDILASTLLVMEASDDAAVLPWARTLRDWRREIVAYFSYPVTNGFTEGCHTKIKLLKRLTYGSRNIQLYLRKVLLGFLPHSPETLAPQLWT